MSLNFGYGSSNPEFAIILLYVIILVVLIIPTFILYLLEWIGGVVSIYIQRGRSSINRSNILLWMVIPTILAYIFFMIIAPTFLWIVITVVYILILSTSIITTFLVGYFSKKVMDKKIKNHYIEYTICVVISYLIVLITINLLFFIFSLVVYHLNPLPLMQDSVGRALKLL